MLRFRLLLVCLGVILFRDHAALSQEGGPAETSATVQYLAQGWNADDRIQFYYTTQGSQLIPYDWFLKLEQAGSEEPFRSEANMTRLGFLPHAAERRRNPDGLPIGFVKDESRPGARDTDPRLDPEVKASYVRKTLSDETYDAKDFPVVDVWLGLTCAACHTTNLQHEDKTFRIDGGAALSDAERFLRELAEAVEATIGNDEKMTRFAKAVLDTGYNETEAEALRERMQAYSQVLAKLVRRGTGTTPYGYGRLDAFGAILNEICETALEMPENYYPADAPASYPFLWDTPQLDWVQWNGSVGNPMGRNIGEALGVFAPLRLLPDPPEKQFRSTAHVVNLFELERAVRKLKAPCWPFEKPKDDQVAMGKALYAQNCAKCHRTRDDSGRFPMVQIAGHDYIQTKLVSVDEIGTDPKHADNFVLRRANPGPLADLFKGMKAVPRPFLLNAAVEGVIHRNAVDLRLDKAQLDEMNGHRPEKEQAPDPWSYKARPLNGVWATAPYLHNGSVPTLYHLLLPDYERPKTFYVGSRRFDTKHVGFEFAPSKNAFEFRVLDQRGREIPGNSNRGHSGKYYTHQRSRIDGTIREFTDPERWALIAYIKTLK